MSAPSPDPSAGPLVPSVAISYAIEIDAPENKGEDVTEEVRRSMPFNGLVSQIYIDFPSGTKDRAGFKIIDDERGIEYFPWDEETEFASFDGVSEFWPVTLPAKEDDDIVIKYINSNWNVDQHFLKVWLIFVGEDGLPADLDDYAARDGVTLE